MGESGEEPSMSTSPLPKRLEPRTMRVPVVAGVASIALLVSCAVPVVAASAADTVPSPEQSLLADFTFDAAPTGGAFVDRTTRASVVGAPDLVPGKTGQGTAARISPSSWLDLTATDGKAVLAGRQSVTISYDSKPDSAANAGWTVFAARSATRQEYAQEHYLGVLDRTSGVTVERYDNATGRNTSGNLDAPAANAEWKHVDLVVTATTTRLFVDRKPVAVNASGIPLTQILGSSGGVLQVGKANWGGGEYFSGLVDNLRIYDRALSGTELGAEATALPSDAGAALAVPSTVLGDLPSRVLGKQVTWAATGAGASRVQANGAVDTTGLGTGTAAVTLTATVEGSAQTYRWDSRIAAAGGRIATYVKTVTTTDGTKDDPLAYQDDRRADALYAAALPAGSTTWEPLNRAQAILYVGNDGDQGARPNAQVGSPGLFRFANGALGAVSSQNNATDSIYVWTSPEGRTFTQQRAVRIAPGSVVSDPRIVFDATSQKYKVFWTDLLTGEGRVTVLADLTTSTALGVTSKADVRALGVQGAGLPSWATQDQASDLALSTTEFETFYKNYVDLRNTGVEKIDASVAQGAGAGGVAAALPKQASLTYNDGSKKSLNVDWQDDLSGVDTSKPGTYQVSGTVQQDPEEMVSDARADPFVFLNPDDGYYYLTGSHYGQPSTGPIEESSSYRKIGLKRATTLAGLQDAPEQIVIDPDKGTPGKQAQYPNTFYGWGGYIWAQEFHKINGTWWIVAGMNKGYAPVGGWCDNTVMIPYTGTDASIAAGGFLDQSNWGEPVVLDGAAFDVSYFERTEAGAQQGYWIMPNGGQILIGKAKMGPKGTVPLVDGQLTRVYSESQPWESGKRSPTPSDTSEGADQGIVEAPFMVQQGDAISITYSGGTVDKYYSLGLLTTTANADLQDPASWKQTAFPVLDTNDTSTGRIGADETAYYTKKQAGTGHNSFARDESGNLVLAYHARPYPDPHTATDPQGAGGLFDSDRNTWFKAVNVRANGTLDLSLTKDQEVAPANRTVTATVVVRAATSAVTSTATSRCVSGKAVVTIVTKNTGAATVVTWATPWGERTQSIGAQKTATLAITTRATAITAGTLSGTAVAGTVSTPVTTAYPAARCG
ncbi:hypothetical protein C5C13_06855 [Clavibacter michiganensis]|nr:hypothetical protein C5C13_06855 [Clavibacter michiganensis]